MKIVRNKVVSIILILSLAFTLMVSVSFMSLNQKDLQAQASTLKSDPSFNIIAGADGDIAYINEDGTVGVDITPTPGFGARANASNLGEFNLLDVKKFSTEIEFTDVPIGVTTFFGLQTIATGTVGSGNGNAVGFMFRRDSIDVVAVSIYDQAANEPAYWAPGHMTLKQDKTIKIEIDYDGANTVTLTVADPIGLGTGLVTKERLDQHYKNDNYKGYFSLSSYSFASPMPGRASYTIKTINGKTPLANYQDSLTAKITSIETAIDTLTAESTIDEINAVSAKNVFTTDAYKTLVATIGTEAQVQAVEDINESLALYAQKGQSQAISDQIDAFETALNNADLEDSDSLETALQAYEAIQLDELALLDDMYKTPLTTKLEGLTDGEIFNSIILTKTENYVASCEQMVSAGDSASLTTYNTLSSNVKDWSDYKTENFINDTLSADQIKAFDDRIAVLQTELDKSFYNGLWTEGNTYEAVKSDLGLYVSGQGKYFETLGFNQKLELNKTTTVSFNIIYALRKLGANHLHIGFYPAVEKGTKGDTDGVRVDFWFSENNIIEIKPVNGKTETAIYDTAYISLADQGFIDTEADELDYTQGKYDITLKSEDGVLILVVNDQEMELTGIDPSIFADGVYLTFSSMAVEGADNNEILVTKLGDTYFAPSQEPTDDDDSTSGSTSKPTTGSGCGGSLQNNLPLFMIIVMSFALMMVIRKKQKANN